MLCELMSDEYIAYDKPRGRITFHPGLNTVLGGKQIFIAYDKQEAPTPRIQEILNETTIIHLSENGNELFGYSWAKKTNKEENVAE
ncbi:hypothetical protein [Mitsuokella jalaludinii]|uniref:hypothetical protein n=1 Tax=Mitsuokella jalaludinii TaxID=187979 RepID=UPI00242E7468|nr:hypothetical protein [Mitsuokella jalaludinii]